MKNTVGLIYAYNQMGPGKVIANIKKGFDIIGQPYVDNKVCEINRYLNRTRDTIVPANALLGPNFEAPCDYPDFYKKHKHFVFLSDWIINLYKSSFSWDYDNVFHRWDVPIDTNMFFPQKRITQDCFIYFKNRNEADLLKVKQMLDQLKLTYSVIQYYHYTEQQLIDACNSSKFCIVIDSTEHCSLAHLEIQAMDVPLLVDDLGPHPWKKHGVSSCPNLPIEGGCVCEKYITTDDIDCFISNLDNFSPRKHIVMNNRLEKSALEYLNLLKESHGL